MLEGGQSDEEASPLTPLSTSRESADSYDARGEQDRLMLGTGAMAAAKGDDPHASRLERDTSFLYGLRGMAAVIVFNQHTMPYFHNLPDLQSGFGEGGRYFLIGLPWVHLFFEGLQISSFFLMSGYCISIQPLRKIYKHKGKECRRDLLSSLVRRPIRLYLPPIVMSLIAAIAVHTPGPIMAPGKHLIPQKTLAEELYKWLVMSILHFSIFHADPPDFPWFPYLRTMWTMPVELRGSLMIYGVLLIMTFVCRGSNCRVPLAVTALMFGTAVFMMQINQKWTWAAFLFGMTLAMLDTWPIGEHVVAFVQSLKGARLIRIISKLFILAQSTMVKCATPLGRCTPSWVLRRFARPISEKPSRGTKWTWWYNFCFVAGWYLISEPGYKNQPERLANTPGWKWVYDLTPRSYEGTEEFHCFGQLYGATLVLYGVLRLEYLQRFFNTRPMKFLGYISFMLYLVHLPWYDVFPIRFVRFVKGRRSGRYDTGKWFDFEWSGVPDFGPVGLSSRVWLCILVTWPSTFFVAWLATKYIAEPSVLLSRWLVKRMGLESTKDDKGEASGALLPT